MKIKAVLFLMVMVAMFILLGIGCAELSAQDVPAMEVSAGVAFVPLVRTTVAQGDTYVMPEGARQGEFASINFNLNDVVGLKGEVSRTTGRYVADTTQKRVYSTEVLGGLSLNDREINPNVVPSFSVLVGVSRRPYLLSYSGTGMVIQLGGGVDVFVSRKVGVEIGAAWLRPFSQAVGQYEQVRFTIGVVVR